MKKMEKEKKKARKRVISHNCEEGAAIKNERVVAVEQPHLSQ